MKLIANGCSRTRRKIYKELNYDERDKPIVRSRLKTIKRVEQGNLCYLCDKPLPQMYCVLDRIKAGERYTRENTDLICQACDAELQAKRRFTDVAATAE